MVILKREKNKQDRERVRKLVLFYPEFVCSCSHILDRKHYPFLHSMFTSRRAQFEKLLRIFFYLFLFSSPFTSITFLRPTPSREHIFLSPLSLFRFISFLLSYFIFFSIQFSMLQVSYLFTNITSSLSCAHLHFPFSSSFSFLSLAFSSPLFLYQYFV